MTAVHLAKGRSTGFIKWLFLSGVIGTMMVVILVGACYLHFAGNLPKIMEVSDYRPFGVTRILESKEGSTQEIGEFFKERRYLVPYEKIPEVVVHAFISAEDDRFFEHSGVNIVSIIRAGIANFKAGHVVQGGSTITQQVAKSLLLTSERSFDRKIREIILAYRIEKNLTKQQILYLYLNQIYLGHGAYGVQSASRTYFRKDISKITLAEAALLAGMPQAPGKYSPLLNPKRAKERQLYALRRMLENKYITQAQFSEAVGQSIRVYRDEDLNGRYSPYLVEQIRKYLVTKYGEKAVYEDGLTVTIPARADLALVANRSMNEGLRAIDKRIGFRGAVEHLAESGEIEKFLEVQRLKLIEKKVQFKLFFPDGRLSSVDAMNEAGIRSDVGLLDPGELYQAVVVGFDSSKKTARLMIGSVKAELTLGRMKWAKSLRDDKDPQAYRPLPTLPSHVLKKGDVVWVALAQDAPAAGEDVAVSLEQLPQIQGALFSLDVQNGNVLAMVGGSDFGQSEFNRATQAQRQCGSAFKPIIYAAALEKGFTPATIITDSPVVFKDTDGQGSWKPNNYEEKFYGDTTFRQALIKSRNIPTVKIVQSIQVPYLIQYAKRLGMTSQFSPDLSISLGSASISLMDLTRVYALFPRLGRKVEPNFFLKIVDRDGRILEESLPQKPSIQDVSSVATLGTVVHTGAGTRKVAFPEYPLPEDSSQVLDPRVAYVMTHLMKEVVTFGTGHEAKNLGRVAAGKTGTTNDSIDAWFLGFTPQVVTGVWVGFDSQKSIGPGETGARAALPIWLNFMKEAVKSYPVSDFTLPDGIVFEDIDADTGKLSDSRSAIKEAFIQGTQPGGEEDHSVTSLETQSDFIKEDKD